MLSCEGLRNFARTRKLLRLLLSEGNNRCRLEYVVATKG